MRLLHVVILAAVIPPGVAAASRTAFPKVETAAGAEQGRRNFPRFSSDRLQDEGEIKGLPFLRIGRPGLAQPLGKQQSDRQEGDQAGEGKYGVQA
ncbi:MAG: hypothetical protein AAB268_09190 [Elusimicrobiota bacterium]